MRWWLTCALITLAILLVGGAFSFIAAFIGKVMKALEAAMGTADAALGIVTDQINLCQANGYFNVGKGCIIGLSGIIYVVFLALGGIGRAILGRYGQRRDTLPAKAFEQADALGANVKDLASEAAREASRRDADLDRRGVSDDNPMRRILLDDGITSVSISYSTAANASNPDASARQSNIESINRMRASQTQDYEEGTRDLDESDRDIAAEVRAGE
jgi:hypothetical protein